MSVARVDTIAQRTPDPAQDSRPRSEEHDPTFEHHLGMYAAMRAATRPGVAQGIVLGLAGSHVQNVTARDSRSINTQRPSSIKGLTDLAVEELSTRSEPISAEAGVREARPGRGRDETASHPRHDASHRTDNGRAGGESARRAPSQPVTPSPMGTSVSRESTSATIKSIQPAIADAPHAPAVTATAVGSATHQGGTALPSTRAEAVVRIMGANSAPAARAGAVSAPTRAESSVWRMTSSPSRPGQTQPDSEAVAHQVHRGMAGLLSRGGGHVTMRLKPESLGMVHVRIEMRDGVVRARIEASSDSARQLLTEGVGSLKSALEARGLSVDRLEVAQRPGTAMHDPLRGSHDPSASLAGREPESGKGGDENASERRSTPESALERRGTQEESVSEKRDSEEDAASEKRGMSEGRHAEGSAKREDRPEAVHRADALAAGAPRGIWRAEASLDSSMVRLRLDAVA